MLDRARNAAPSIMVGWSLRPVRLLIVVLGRLTDIGEQIGSRPGGLDDALNFGGAIFPAIYRLEEHPFHASFRYKTHPNPEDHCSKMCCSNNVTDLVFDTGHDDGFHELGRDEDFLVPSVAWHEKLQGRNMRIFSVHRDLSCQHADRHQGQNKKLAS